MIDDAREGREVSSLLLLSLSRSSLAMWICEHYGRLRGDDDWDSPSAVSQPCPT